MIYIRNLKEKIEGLLVLDLVSMKGEKVMCKYCTGDMPEFLVDHSYPVSGAESGNPEEEPEIGWYAEILPEDKTLEFNFGINGCTFIVDRIKIKYCPMCGRKM